jgi:hypothetical protein
MKSAYAYPREADQRQRRDRNAIMVLTVDTKAVSVD